MNMRIYGVAGLDTGDSPQFVTTDLTGITDGNIPNMAASATGFEDSPLSTDGTNITSSGAIGSVQYKTIYIDAGAMVSCTTNGAETGTNEYGTNDIEWDYFAFDGGATEERIQFKIVMPEDWDQADTVKAKFYWSSATGSTAGDTVEWGIKAGALANSIAIDTALGTTVTVSDTLLANNGTDLQISGATAVIVVAQTQALGDTLTFEIYRNTDGTDDMTEDAWLFGVLLQYKTASTTVSTW